MKIRAIWAEEEKGGVSRVINIVREMLKRQEIGGPKIKKLG